jgi:hypothetical protein
VWKEKQAQLDELLKAIETTPKLAGGIQMQRFPSALHTLSERMELTCLWVGVVCAAGAMGDVVAEVKKCLKDKNVMVVGKAMKVFTLLNQRTRKEFATHAKALLKEYSAHFKSDKPQVDKVLDAALDAFFEFKCVDLNADCMEVFSENVKNKVEMARIRSIGWFNRYLRNSAVCSTQAVTGVAKPLWELLVGAIGDEKKDVRAAATECTGALLAVCVPTIIAAPNLLASPLFCFNAFIFVWFTLQQVVGKRNLHSQFSKLETKDSKKSAEVLDIANKLTAAASGAAAATPSATGAGSAPSASASASASSKEDDADDAEAEEKVQALLSIVQRVECSALGDGLCCDVGVPQKPAPAAAKKAAPSKKPAAAAKKPGAKTSSDSKGEDAKPSSPSKSKICCSGLKKV